MVFLSTKGVVRYYESGSLIMNGGLAYMDYRVLRIVRKIGSCGKQSLVGLECDVLEQPIYSIDKKIGEKKKSLLNTTSIGAWSH